MLAMMRDCEPNRYRRQSKNQASTLPLVGRPNSAKRFGTRAGPQSFDCQRRSKTRSQRGRLRPVLYDNSKLTSPPGLTDPNGRLRGGNAALIQEGSERVSPTYAALNGPDLVAKFFAR